MDKKVILIVIVVLVVGFFAGTMYNKSYCKVNMNQTTMSDCCALQTTQENGEASDVVTNVKDLKDCCQKSMASIGKACCAVSETATN